MTSTQDRKGGTLVSRSRVFQTGYLIIVSLALAACADKGRDEDAAAEAAALVNTIATEFVDAYYAQFPEEV